MEFLLQPWPWYVAGPMLALVMFLMFYFGEKFGVSSNLETMCSIGGAGKWVDFFKFDWRTQKWHIAFILGIILGGFITNQWLFLDDKITLGAQTIQDLNNLGIVDAGTNFLPEEIYSIDAMFSLKGFLVLITAGMLVGFGSRYAGGCTSGHGIVGLSNLSLESLIAVVGFFIGGLTMTWFIFPYIFK